MLKVLKQLEKTLKYMVNLYIKTKNNGKTTIKLSVGNSVIVSYWESNKYLLNSFLAR